MFPHLLLTIVGLFVAAQIITIALIARADRRRSKRRNIYKIIDLPVIKVNNANVNIYMEGWTLFSDMLAAINQAESRIMFETYIWQNDELGQQFQAAFIQKAKEGIDVYLIYDWLGSHAMGGPPKFPDIPHLHVLAFIPFKKIRHLLRRSRWNVTHRKLLIVDDSISFVGGYNIGDEYMREWRDTHVRFEHETGTDELAFAFVDFWNTYRRKYHPDLPYPPQYWRSDIQLFRNNPLRYNYPIRSLYLKAIERANKRIIITNAYFVPDRSIREALLVAATERNVQIDIVLPWRSNHIIVDWIARHHFEDYLKANIKLYGYNGTMIHAKTITVDGIWSMIGTANLDRLSLMINHEINAEFFDPAVAAQMEAIFAADKNESRVIDPIRWQQRRLAMRVGERLLSPLWPFI
ncbi:MAG TPA: phosphatidylserine/phosphatidylglycerophosphate/cardiolipin synthase family protein [Anaerolineae bacterium]|nr:phosphatidylserine/phosphatidylglycerophosphate/cardiolipin synthase family protein [Anaerolineae bacterium]